MKAKEVGFYRIDGKNLVLERGSHKDYPYPKEIDLADPLINKALESKDVEWKMVEVGVEYKRDIIIAAPLCNELGEVEGVFCVFEIPFMELHQENLDTFKLLLRWLNMSYIKAGKWHELEEQALFIPEKQIYTHRYLKTLMDRSIANYKRYKTSFSISSIEVRVNSSLDIEMVQLLAIQGMYTLLRTGDLVAAGRTQLEFCVFLPSTGEEGAAICTEKLCEAIERQFTPEILQHMTVIFNSGEVKDGDDDALTMLSRVHTVG